MTFVSPSAALAEPLTLDAAHAYLEASALTDSAVGTVGLEVEAHLVDLAIPARQVDWPRVDAAANAGRSALPHSAVTVEPGGQLEISGPPGEDVVAAVAALRHDEQRLRLVLADRGLGLAHLGADPLRSPVRVNPRSRYSAMEEHYASAGRTVAGRTMMCATAALQVNLQAGPAVGWRDRVAQAHRLGPVLMAVAANSRWVAGRRTGWVSARERAWQRLDPRSTAPIRPDADPVASWARYALAAPVVFVASPHGDATPVRTPVPFADWITGQVQLAGRRPAVADLRTHLSTLFPPVRLRGYLEVRFLDISAPRWWPAVAATTAVLMDDPRAADRAAAATEALAHLPGRWSRAARLGLGDVTIAAAARRCLAIAAEHVPAPLAASVTDLAELVESGRCPGDVVDRRIAEVGPEVLLSEVSHA
jgi:glutamate--cysteine ligase